MTTITLQLEPAAAKYFRYHHDSINGASRLQEQFRRIVIMLCEKHDTGIINPVPGLESFSALVAVRNTKYNHDARCAMYIPEHKMRILNDTLISFLEEEINNTVIIFTNQGKQHKEAFQFIIDKYDLDSTDYSYDRMKKMNYRHRNKEVST